MAPVTMGESGEGYVERSMKEGRKRRPGVRAAWLFLAVFALAVGLSLLWEGPRSVYVHAVVICLDCIGLI